MPKIPKRPDDTFWASAGLVEKAAAFIGLKYSDDFRTLFFEGCNLWLFFYLWRNMYTMSWFSLILNWLALCYFSGVTAVIIHNTMHASIFYQGWQNKLFQHVLTLAYGPPVSAYVPAHNLSHHPFPQRPKDVFRTTMMRYKSNFWNLVLFRGRVTDNCLSLDLKFLAMNSKLGRPFFYQAIAETWVFLVTMILCLYLDWFKFLMLFHIPHEISQIWIVAISYMQHDGTDVIPSDDADLTQYPNIARNFIGSWFNFLLMNNGYHSIHHLYPNKHWSELPEVHRKQFIENEDPKLRIHKNLLVDNWLTYLWNHHLKPDHVRARYDGKPVSEEDLNEFPKDEVDLDVFEWSRHVNRAECELDTCSEKLMFMLSASFLWFMKLACPLWEPFTRKGAKVAPASTKMS
jgi:fatty acid desaturase